MKLPIDQTQRKMTANTTSNKDRRKLLSLIGITGIAAGSVPTAWVTPVINSVVLPAHAQTSVCVTDTQVGGPLIGHPSGATTCQAACEDEATTQNALLCDVSETTDASSATICGCDLDT
ncbi:MAG: hypothetical protein KJP04_11975 [Arenicella sp.]|nr:hypothetical protein [Arenicella sp.]